MTTLPKIIAFFPHLELIFYYVKSLQSLKVRFLSITYSHSFYGGLMKIKRKN